MRWRVGWLVLVVSHISNLTLVARNSYYRTKSHYYNNIYTRIIIPSAAGCCFSRSLLYLGRPRSRLDLVVFQLRKDNELLWSLQPRLPFVCHFSFSQTKPASLVQDAFPACLVISHVPSPYRPHPFIGMALAKTSRPSTLRKVVSHSPDGSLWKSSQGNV